jgi:outer membrane murein-binding lipoprotein Lpp
MGFVRLMLKIVLPAVIAITMLAGCAGTAPDDDAAIGRWQAR